MKIMTKVLKRFSLLFLSSLVLFTAQSAQNYVGTPACRECHQKIYQQWQQSHHKKSMEHATTQSVLGRFNNQTIDIHGQSYRLFKKNSKFWVELPDENHKAQTYQILYTFGFYPLQQYIVERKRGHLQLIPLAWDAREANQGGQRWFHLYPETDPSDEFFWTNKGQNWNAMCADCHSSGIEKNYNINNDSYQTTWQEINVGCEACHGSGKNHVAWAKQTNQSPIRFAGFQKTLQPKIKRWRQIANKKTLQPAEQQASAQIETCAQCHSHRMQLNERTLAHKDDYHQRYKVSLITPELYHHDGQTHNESFVYGSFVQSVMHQKGVVCTDCHQPHSAKIKQPDNAVCHQCHLNNEFNAENHSFHTEGTAGSKCVDCHMVTTTHMQVDPRHDHSFNVPRPDLSESTGVPNACHGCHNEQSNAWALKQIKTWFPKSKRFQQSSVAEAFHAYQYKTDNALQKLGRIARDVKLSSFIRASALQRIRDIASQDSYRLLTSAIRSHKHLERRAAIAGTAAFTWSMQWRMLSPLLSDPMLPIRTEAANILVTHWLLLNKEQRRQLSRPLDEYLSIQRFNADRAFARVNIGNVYAAQRNLEGAIKAYQGAIKIEPIFPYSYINLANIYRHQKKPMQEFETLKQGLKATPKSAPLHYAMGMTAHRNHESKQARLHLKQAAHYAPDEAQYWYAHALAEQKSEPEIAVQALKKAYDISKNRDFLKVLCQIQTNNHSEKLQQCLKLKGF